MIQMDVFNDIVECETEKFKRAIEINKIKVDDLLDPFKGHRSIHEAVLFDNLEIVKFLIKNDAHLMARDYNGVTPLIKAVALNRLNIVRIFIFFKLFF
jgi:ankyrin repeat protein